MTKLLPTFAFLALLLPAATASAKKPGRDTDRPWTFDAGIGPMVNLERSGGLGKLGFDFHYHFNRSDVGPALGLTFYTHFREKLFGIQVGQMFLWDFRVYRDKKLAMYLAPLVALGYSLTHYVGTGGAASGNDHHFFMDFGAQWKTVFKDRVGVFVRPATFSLLAGKGGATGFYTTLIGVTTSF